ncbi:MAG: SDR family NAD(P)-dependent oxidoreductase [Saprospiraceae bacterium]
MRILENRVAIVSGAGSGMSKAMALLYASKGAKVIVFDFNETSGNETVLEIMSDGGEAFFIKADLSKQTFNQGLIDYVASHYSGFHITCW